MEYKEYGSKNNDIIILLHGGGLSWWNYIDEISLLENEFHIVIPILDGHSGSDTKQTSHRDTLHQSKNTHRQAAAKL